jgi:hypothetical protein
MWVAGDVAEGIDGEDDGEAEGEGDRERVERQRRLPSERREECHDRARAEEDEHVGPDRLRDRRGGKRSRRPPSGRRDASASLAHDLGAGMEDDLGVALDPLVLSYASGACSSRSS